MVDGVMLLVDASEGPLPQTRYVLSKALEAKLPPILVINKIDRPDARAAGSAQRGLRPVHRSRRRRGPARLSRALHQRQDRHRDHRSPTSPARTCVPSSRPSSTPFPSPQGDADGPLQILVANLDYSDYLGRIAIARVFNGTLRTGEEVAIAKRDGSLQKTKITKLFSFSGLKRTDIVATELGDIVAIAGVEGINIGETITDVENPCAAAGHHHRRAHHRHPVHGEHLALRRTRRPVRHLAQPARPPAKKSCSPTSRCAWKTPTAPTRSGYGPRRAATGHPDRDDAPRRLRARGRQARDRHQARSTAS